MKELLPELAPDEKETVQEKRSIRERLDENRRAIQKSEIQHGGSKTEKAKGREQQL